MNGHAQAHSGPSRLSQSPAHIQQQPLGPNGTVTPSASAASTGSSSNIQLEGKMQAAPAPSTGPQGSLANPPSTGGGNARPVGQQQQQLSAGAPPYFHPGSAAANGMVYPPPQGMMAGGTAAGGGGGYGYYQPGGQQHPYGGYVGHPQQQGVYPPGRSGPRNHHYNSHQRHHQNQNHHHHYQQHQHMSPYDYNHPHSASGAGGPSRNYNQSYGLYNGGGYPQQSAYAYSQQQTPYLMYPPNAASGYPQPMYYEPTMFNPYANPSGRANHHAFGNAGPQTPSAAAPYPYNVMTTPEMPPHAAGGPLPSQTPSTAHLSPYPAPQIPLSSTVSSTPPPLPRDADKPPQPPPATSSSPSLEVDVSNDDAVPVFASVMRSPATVPKEVPAAPSAHVDTTAPAAEQPAQEVEGLDSTRKDDIQSEGFELDENQTYRKWKLHITGARALTDHWFDS